jgi:hypothetical protein
MRHTKFTDTILKQNEVIFAVPDFCRAHGISSAMGEKTMLL